MLRDVKTEKKMYLKSDTSVTEAIWPIRIKINLGRTFSLSRVQSLNDNTNSLITLSLEPIDTPKQLCGGC